MRITQYQSETLVKCDCCLNKALYSLEFEKKIDGDIIVSTLNLIALCQKHYDLLYGQMAIFFSPRELIEQQLETEMVE